MSDLLSYRRLSPGAFIRSLCLLTPVALALGGAAHALRPPSPPLVLERTIALPGVAGRVDHLAEDSDGRRLFVAALGNNTVEVVDLRLGRAIARLTGQSEPQGLAWLPGRHELVVASGDGRFDFYGGGPLGRTHDLKLGDDADNVRLDALGRPVVGYGSGALAIVEPTVPRVARAVRLPGHPESFRIEGEQAFVNVPDAGRIVTVDLATGGTLASWPTPGAAFNFPMALDATRQVLAVVFRLPPRLRLLDPRTGCALLDVPTCGDADDLYFDPPRRRLYVICGAGEIDVFQASGAADYRPVARVATVRGARTGLFSPEDDRLYVAARAIDGRQARILVYRTVP